MTSYLEIKRLYDDPSAAAVLARQLRIDKLAGWSDWERDFLDSMVQSDRWERLSTRQAEVLIELRDRSKVFHSIGGFSVSGLIRQCWEAQLDLAEDDAEFIDRLHAAGRNWVGRGEGMKLIWCAKELQLIEGYVELVI